MSEDRPTDPPVGGEGGGCEVIDSWPEEEVTGQLPSLALRILVVDDSAVVRRTVHRHLAGRGYMVQTAASGEEAFDVCLREPFDLLVSDVTMGTLSGMQLCRLLRSDPATADMPIILLTAAGDPRSRFWGRHAGADEYLPKESIRCSWWRRLAGWRAPTGSPAWSTGAPRGSVSSTRCGWRRAPRGRCASPCATWTTSRRSTTGCTPSGGGEGRAPVVQSCHRVGREADRSGRLVDLAHLRFGAPGALASADREAEACARAGGIDSADHLR